MAPSCAVILVEDTLEALQRLAAWWRSELTLTVIGLTGSNGKTSTKDLTASVLSQGLRTIATQGNLNNHIGVPLSILRAAPSDEAAVWEMGMNHSGELAPLCEMTRPKSASSPASAPPIWNTWAPGKTSPGKNARWHTACRKTAS